MPCGALACPVRTHGSCVLNTYEGTIGCSRTIPFDEDARAVRPYQSREFPACYSSLLTPLFSLLSPRTLYLVSTSIKICQLVLCKPVL